MLRKLMVVTGPVPRLDVAIVAPRISERIEMIDTPPSSLLQPLFQFLFGSWNERTVQWFESCPVLTKYWLTGAILAPLAVEYLGVVHARDLTGPSYDNLFLRQPWRWITPFLLCDDNIDDRTGHGSSWALGIVHSSWILVVLASTSRSYEERFSYAKTWIFGAILLLLTGPAIVVPIVAGTMAPIIKHPLLFAGIHNMWLCPPMVTYISTLLQIRCPIRPVKLLSLTMPFTSSELPWVLAMLSVLLGGNVVLHLYGVVLASIHTAIEKQIAKRYK